jgi:Peptidase A4 family
LGFRRSWLGLLVTLAVLPAFGQVSTSPAENAAEKIARHQHGPIRDKTEHRDASKSVGSSTSSNWSGYAVLGSSFTSVKGSWVVPTAVCPGGDQWAAFWVGLDGYSSDTVEQTGTDSDCDGDNNPSYYAWYEFYPNPSYAVMSVNPGDRISASVVYNGSEFTITITDENTGQSRTKSSSVRGAQRSSAEWITEAPCCTSRPRDGILPLSDFVTVGFGSDSTAVAGTNSATDSTTSGNIASFPTIWEINKTGSSTSPQTSTCSALSADGTSFSCSWNP